MALFRVDAEHRCIDRRLEVQTDDIGSFFLELRIVTGNITAQSMRLEPDFGQDARYPDVVGAHFGGNLASRPMRRALWTFMERFLGVFPTVGNKTIRPSPETTKALAKIS